MKQSSCVKSLAWVAFLVIGLAVFVPRYLRANSRSTLPACRSNLKNIGTALEMYSTDWSGTYPESLSTLTPDYLKTLPKCPTAGKVSYKMVVGPGVGYNTKSHLKHELYQDYYLIWCAGDNHKNHRLKPNFPMYDGLTGLIAERLEGEAPILVQAPIKKATPTASPSPGGSASLDSKHQSLGE